MTASRWMAVLEKNGKYNITARHHCLRVHYLYPYQKPAFPRGLGTSRHGGESRGRLSILMK